ncbi:hypothetical protein D043_2462B, partial [Vibrio parahaemolyticus EKP-021]
KAVLIFVEVDLASTLFVCVVRQEKSLMRWRDFCKFMV